jgi:hypothetical protein
VSFPLFKTLENGKRKMENGEEQTARANVGAAFYLFFIF